MGKERKCKDCIWLDLNSRSSIGYYCVCPNIQHKGLAVWQQLYKPACKTGFKEKYESQRL